jgi:TonB family protein
VLSRRARQAEGRPASSSVVAAVGLHLLVLAAAILVPRLTPAPKPLEFVPVTVLPAAALGVPRPRSERRPEPPAPDPKPAPQEEPAPQLSTPPPPEPVRERPAPEPEPAPPVRPEAPVLPQRERQQPRPEPRTPTPSAPAPSRPAPTRPAPATPPRAVPPARPLPTPTPPSAAPGDQIGRRGSATGTAAGTTAFGSQIAGLDNPDFTYGYYIDRLLAAIDANWVRPRVDGTVRAIVSFRIGRDGSLVDLTIKESSGYNAFDLAVLRAVQNAAPLPPLPRAYRHDSLGVNLIVR